MEFIYSEGHQILYTSPIREKLGKIKNVNGKYLKMD